MSVRILDIFQEAQKELILVDGYADKTLLDIVKNVKCNVIIVTKTSNNLFRSKYSKYVKQYNNLIAIYNNTFHDRYFIIDNNTMYHCGTSINYAGSKTFSINLLEDEMVKISLINKINDIIKEKK